MIERICKQCGNKFLAHLSDIKRGGGKFCSKDCSSKYHIGENNSSWTNRISKVCKQCGKQFKISGVEERKGRGAFCSHKCYTIWAKENGIMKIGSRLSQSQKDKISLSNKGKVVSRLTRDKISKSLVGKMIGVKNPMFGKKRHHSEGTRYKISLSNIGRICSGETRKKLSESRKGEKSSRFIHGKHMSSYCYKFTGKGGVRERSLAFFNYKCIECGKTNEQNKLATGKNLNVHHVYYRKMSCCENELKYDHGVLKIDNKLYIKESNGDTTEHEINGKPEKFAVLCSSCHAKTTVKDRLFWIQYYENKINKKYNGKSFLTKEEYDLFLKNK